MNKVYFTEMLRSTIESEIQLIFELSDKLNETKISDIIKKDKLLSLLKQHKSKLEKLLIESDKLNIKGSRKLFKSYDNFIVENEAMQLNQPSTNSAFHLFQNSNLFVTSLIIYALLMSKENEVWIQHLVDSAPTKEKKLSLIIQKSIRVQEIQSFVEGLHPQLTGKTTKSLKVKNNFLPKYSTSKKIAGYRAELKRTLSKGKFMCFQNIETLDLVASLILNPRYARLRSLIINLRYNQNLDHSKAYKIILSKNKKELLLMKGEVEHRTIMKFS